jgi:cyclic pyranopterin monophosphate synthase
MSELSHTNKKGEARMVDVGHKPLQERVAVAQGFISLHKQTLALITDNQMKKGDVLAVARIAGIQAAKRTPELIPLCHTLLLSSVDLDACIETEGVRITATVKCTGQTGVEMEALTAVSVALLTVYDMCKAVDKSMVMHDIKLLEKRKQ